MSVYCLYYNFREKSMSKILRPSTLRTHFQVEGLGYCYYFVILFSGYKQTEYFTAYLL